MRALAASVAPVVGPLRKAWPWAMAAWALHDLRRQGRHLDPALPRLIVRERELRPWM